MAIRRLTSVGTQYSLTVVSKSGETLLKYYGRRLESYGESYSEVNRQDLHDEQARENFSI